MKIKLGILKEQKNPKDNRVALTPDDAQKLMQSFPDFEVFVQPDAQRCFSDDSYQKAGCHILDDVAHCAILLGVKEVPVEHLLAQKTYFFFSHTIKKQAYNRTLLQTILEKKIKLIDYECITDSQGNRLIAFGRFAGIVGTHNTLAAYGKRTGLFHFPAAHSFLQLDALFKFYTQQKMPPLKIILTGGGRVAKGAIEVLQQLNIKQVAPNDFLSLNLEEAVFTQLDTQDLYFRKDGKSNLPITDFYTHPHLYDCLFQPYYTKGEIMINAIFWHPDAPRFFSLSEMKSKHFLLKTIGDISCDINGSVPATIRSSTIQNPVYGFHPFDEKEVPPFLPEAVDIMAVDNLPNELPQDASRHFSEVMTQTVLPQLLLSDSEILNRATIAQNGNLNKPFFYLKKFVLGEE